MTHAQNFGRWGEDKATNFLARLGYEILERNWRGAEGEIDILARNEKEMVVVEVKTRAEPVDGDEYMRDAQAHRLLDAAEFWMEERDIEAELRCDLILVIGNSENYRIKHIQDAWRGGPQEL
jgi:putative endonuclease